MMTEQDIPFREAAEDDGQATGEVQPKFRIGRGWTDSWLAPSGGEARRRTRRTHERDAKNNVKRANRRRFRAWESQQHATSTLISQVRIYSGEIGNERQRARVTAMFTHQARELGQPVDEVIAALRTGLGLAG